MAEQMTVASEPGKDIAKRTLKEFLESVAPGKIIAIAGESIPIGEGLRAFLSAPPIELICDSDVCQGIRIFDAHRQAQQFAQDEVHNFYWSYTCRNCQKVKKIYSLRVRSDTPTKCYLAMKFGETPGFGPATPSHLKALLDKSFDTFIKGRRCENQALGIGAFSYYRRIVESLKDELFIKIIAASRKLSADPALIADLEAARRETQFSKAVGVIHHALPATLFLNGANPLTLLHDALSDGLHDLSDDECLEIATLIRSVLTRFSERLTQVLSADDEVDAAVTKLAQRRQARLAAKAGAERKPASSQQTE